MRNTNYPKPDRSNYEPRKRAPRSEPFDIGWQEGVLGDGRPYRLECWAEDGVTMVTVFVSMIGLETMDDDAAGEMLEREQLVEFRGSDRFVSAAPLVDAAGQRVWSINVVVGDRDDTFVHSSVPLRPYED